MSYDREASLKQINEQENIKSDKFLNIGLIQILPYYILYYLTVQYISFVVFLLFIKTS